MVNTLVSIIVPVYNAQDYIQECVNSIVHQTYSNLEIVLVDDGSKDKSGAMCDDFSKSDSRIKVIHKINGGLANARNTGVDCSTGSFIVFLDNDDVLAKDFVEYALDKIIAYQADMFIMPYQKFIKNVDFPNANDQIHVIDSYECLKHILMHDPCMPISSHSKIFKRELCLKHRFAYLYEDSATVYKFVLDSNKIVASIVPRYGYRIREGSIMREKFSIKKMDIIDVTSHMYEDIIEVYPDLKDTVSSRCISNLMNVFLQINRGQYKEQQNQLWDEIKRYRLNAIIGKNVRRKAKVSAVMSYFGKDIIRFIYKLFNTVYSS